MASSNRYGYFYIPRSGDLNKLGEFNMLGGFNVLGEVYLSVNNSGEFNVPSPFAVVMFNVLNSRDILIGYFFFLLLLLLLSSLLSRHIVTFLFSRSDFFHNYD